MSEESNEVAKKKKRIKEKREWSGERKYYYFIYTY